jgi:hypothetical protein
MVMQCVDNDQATAADPSGLDDATERVQKQFAAQTLTV